VRHGLAALLGILVLVLAACGGGSGGGSSTGGGTSVSAADFRKQADAICAKYEEKLNDIGQPTSVSELGDFVDKAVPLIEQGNTELQKLQPPDELQADWDRAMAIQDENLQKTRDLQDAVHKNDQAAMQKLFTDLGSNQAESQRLATKIGLQNCGQSQTQ
jgi:transcriptional regulator of aromatic amino acid metabolism